ncbi:MAG: hypothetical protein ACRAS9_01075 [Mycoplasma sp.]
MGIYTPSTTAVRSRWSKVFRALALIIIIGLGIATTSLAISLKNANGTIEHMNDNPIDPSKSGKQQAEGVIVQTFLNSNSWQKKQGSTTEYLTMAEFLGENLISTFVSKLPQFDPTQSNLNAISASSSSINILNYSLTPDVTNYNSNNQKYKVNEVQVVFTCSFTYVTDSPTPPPAKGYAPTMEVHLKFRTGTDYTQDKDPSVSPTSNPKILIWTDMISAYSIYIPNSNNPYPDGN